jgi:hypothetical protein
VCPIGGLSLADATARRESIPSNNTLTRLSGPSGGGVVRGSSLIAISMRPYVALPAVAAVATGCASNKRHDVARENSTAAAPFSKTVVGSGDAVCWSVKRALLSQGYMLDRPTESGVLTGTRDFQPQTTVASNAANNKKPPATRNAQAWYHYFWW